jgi:hypothetical protein
VLLDKEEMVQQGMIDRLTKTGRCSRMAMNVGRKNEGSENLKGSIPDRSRISGKWGTFQLFV